MESPTSEGRTMLTRNAQYPPNKRRRTVYAGGGTARICPHCNRSFKRTEHLERHVRTHTKEKPFICHCGAAFTRRDLLTRHHRITLHGDESKADTPQCAGILDQESETRISPRRTRDRGTANFEPPVPPALRSRSGGTGEADLDAAGSFSGLSVDPWVVGHGSLPNTDNGTSASQQGRRNTYVDVRSHGQGVLSPQLMDSSFQLDVHFREFANFLDGVGLPSEWSPYFSGPDRLPDPADTTLGTDHDEASVSPAGQPRSYAGTPFTSWLPSAPTGNKISNDLDESHGPRAVDPEMQSFKVTDEQHARICASLDDVSHLLDESFKLPSRHALTRYVTSYFEGFHLHLPFIHSATWCILEHPLELILGLSAIGAQYSFEHRTSERLFFAGKAILLNRLTQEADRFGPRTRSIIALNSRGGQSRAFRDSQRMQPMETIRALIALMGFATWEPQVYMVQEAFALQSLLTNVLRDTGLDEELDASEEGTQMDQGAAALDSQWRIWVQRESCRRSKLIAFSFLHTHSIAYNVYPVLRSNEVNLRLPCSTKEWKASTASQWKSSTKEAPKQQLYYQEALSLLLTNKNSSAPLDPIPTPLGNYVLLHGLLQRIHIVRDLSLPATRDTPALPNEEVETLERGLRSWTTGWQQAPESTLDPNNDNGPIPFTSSSLLSLAYVRLHLNLGPYRELDTRDPTRIARALRRVPDVERSDGVIAALLYATHMLGIPVRLGVDRVARSQAFFWSVRHSLSSLDCSVLLSRWLSTLSDTIADTPPTDSEDRIMYWVRCIVEEAYAVVDFENEPEDLMDFGDPANLSLAVLKIWARFFKSNTQWPFINIIGASLEGYRDMLVRQKLEARQDQRV